MSSESSPKPTDGSIERNESGYRLVTSIRPDSARMIRGLIGMNRQSAQNNIGAALHCYAATFFEDAAGKPINVYLNGETWPLLEKAQLPELSDFDGVSGRQAVDVSISEQAGDIIQTITMLDGVNVGDVVDQAIHLQAHYLQNVLAGAQFMADLSEE